MIKFFTCLFLLFGFSLFLSSQQKQADSLGTLLKTDKEDTTKVKHLNILAQLLEQHGEFEVSLQYANQALILAQKNNYFAGTAKANTTLASIYYYKSDYLKALNYYMDGLKVDSLHGYSIASASILSNIARIYNVQGIFSKALEYDLKALKIAKLSKDKKGEARYIGNMGDIYLSQGDYKNALDDYSQSLKLSKELNDKEEEARSLMRIGSVATQQNDYRKAIEYFLKTLTIASGLHNEQLVTNSLGNLGIAYGSEGNYKEAIKYCSEAAERAEKVGDKIDFAINSSNLGNALLEQKKYEDAIKYLTKSTAIADSIKDYEVIRDGNENLSEAYMNLGQWQKAYQYHLKYSAAKDTLISRDKSKEIGRLEAKFDYDKQLSAQQAEEDKAKELAEAKSKRQQIINLLAISIALIIGLIAVIIYRSLRYAKKEKILVEKEKILMELKALRAQMNPHFIFNAINSIQSFILENDKYGAQKHLSRFSKLMRMVLENSSYENIPISDEIKMLELYLEFERIRFSSRFWFKIMVDDSIDKDNIFISPLLIQPYVENAIWHGLMHLTGRQGEVSIHFELQNNQLKCSIDDNGIGREQSMKLKKDSVHKSMGLSIAAERLEIINALFKSKMSVNFTDKINTDGTAAGTRVELLMPIITNIKTYA